MINFPFKSKFNLDFLVASRATHRTTTLELMCAYALIVSLFSLQLKFLEVRNAVMMKEVTAREQHRLLKVQRIKTNGAISLISLQSFTPDLRPPIIQFLLLFLRLLSLMFLAKLPHNVGIVGGK